MANQIDSEKSKILQETRFMYGRRMILSDETTITRDNVLKVLADAMEDHYLNRSEINYLYNYYKGRQPIVNRVKDVRPDICNKVVVNHANEIVSFKTGYLVGEPIQYVNRKGDDGVTEQINLLNEYMFSEDKASQDEEIVEWGNICGTAFRLILPDEDAGTEPDEAPFEMYTLDPRDTFVVYSSGIGNRPLMGVKYRTDKNNIQHVSVYTDHEFFRIENGIIVEEKPHALGMVPIFEYPANNARLGAFEIVMPILDAINKTESNRIDGVEQIVQAFIKFINCDISLDEYQDFISQGAIKVKSTDGAAADVDTVTTELNQDQSQTLQNDLYTNVLVICGMPNRNGGASTSDTGAAVIMRDGWSTAEARAKDSEHMFKLAEKKALRLVLKICNQLSDTFSLKLSDIDLKFTRRNYEAIQSKSQVLISMLQEPKIHPLLAYESSGMFVDPESAYSLSMDYYEKTQQRALEIQNSESNAENAAE